ncbi:MAG: YdjY domain-containing protein [Pirellulales bacterium]
MPTSLLCSCALALSIVATAVAIGRAQEAAPDGSQPATPKRRLAKDPPGMQRLMPEYDVWIDARHKRVVMDGTVVLRQGQLEMLACPKGTKEHESIIAVDTKAYAVHAGLLAVGASVGTPVAFQPEYKPATGTEVDIEIVWRDAKGQDHRERAQDWVRNVQTGKAMEYPWVFAGSGFWTDEASGTKYYMAEQGDFVCVSNFPSAMLDLPVKSSQDNQQLVYEAFTEHIPPLGTRVRLVLTPQLKEAKEAKEDKTAEGAK